MTDRMAALRELAATNAAPQAITPAGLQQRFGMAGATEPTRGQVWRTRWDADVLLVLLLTTSEDKAHAVPVTIDPSGRDGQSLIAPASMTAFGVDTAVWCGLRCELPFRVLDQVVDHWQEELVCSCERGGDAEPGSLETGTSGGWEVDEADLRCDIEARLDRLAHAPACASRHEGGPPTRDLRGLEALTLPVVKTLLGLSQPEAMAVLRARRPLPLTQARVLADRAGVSVDEVLARVPGLPAALITEVEHPRWRWAITHLARRDSHTETEVRERVAQGAYALAARQSGGDAQQWRGRIQRYLEPELASREY
ncbi:hypothetical protein F4561_005193 [Lipingzhangella halophila]|uniref:Uncharacterized protein n=1 Tax=Lipingzhangella halophila TaxID=1783352 RepID=A0A7W7RML4_9ACTN|nr:hypothetical protein [Lipingzhangella halophila]MBB4934373.1 hypothetical protein [Lipingzhangella halophila]